MAARRSSALAASLAVALAACVGPSTPAEDARGDDAITVASFGFPESVLLAEIYAQAIEGAGIRVEREPSLGPRELVMPALLQGLVEFVPEYAGSGLQFLAGDGSTSPDHAINHERFAERLEPLDVTALDASPAEDQNGFAVTTETAQRYGRSATSRRSPASWPSGDRPNAPGDPSASQVWSGRTGSRSGRSSPTSTRAVLARSPPWRRGRWTWRCCSRATARST
jgi:osmoprotectant transport system substrate-binding protein